VIIAFLAVMFLVTTGQVTIEQLEKALKLMKAL
jgi:chromatin segregation and condensation protein Rec8/ScpA/Scc1 (kleisin family)